MEFSAADSQLQPCSLQLCCCCWQLDVSLCGFVKINSLSVWVWFYNHHFLCCLTGVKCEQLTQKASVTVQPGQHLTITCQVSYSVSSYYTGWIRQPAGKGLEWIGSKYPGYSYYKPSLKNKFSISLDSSSNTVTLNGVNVQPEDTAVYYCARDTTTQTIKRAEQKPLRASTQHHHRGRNHTKNNVRGYCLMFLTDSNITIYEFPSVVFITYWVTTSSFYWQCEEIFVKWGHFGWSP